MTLVERFQHLLGRSRKETRATQDIGGTAKAGADLDEFVAVRSANLVRMTEAEVDEMAASALTTVDREETLREAKALRERWNVRSKDRPGRTS